METRENYVVMPLDRARSHVKIDETNVLLASEMRDFFTATKRALRLMVWLLKRSKFQNADLDEFRAITLRALGSMIAWLDRKTARVERPSP